jgi:hypothetical protein
MLKLDSIAVEAKDVLCFGGTGMSRVNKELCGIATAVMKDSP